MLSIQEPVKNAAFLHKLITKKNWHLTLLTFFTILAWTYRVHSNELPKLYHSPLATLPLTYNTPAPPRTLPPLVFLCQKPQAIQITYSTLLLAQNIAVMPRICLYLFSLPTRQSIFIQLLVIDTCFTTQKSTYHLLHGLYHGLHPYYYLHKAHHYCNLLIQKIYHSIRCLTILSKPLPTF